MMFINFVIRPLTGNAIPNAIGFDLANLLFAVISWVAIGMVVMSAVYNYKANRKYRLEKEAERAKVSKGGKL